MIKNRVTFKQLEAFVCVVDTGTFRKAAAVLGTTQPNISTRIAALETVLGTVLMHRDAGSVRITDKGAELLEAARVILRAGEQFLEIAGRRDLIEDRLRLGVTELVACTWLHDFLRAFKRLYPAVRVELDVNLSTDIEKALITHDLDLALQTGPFARSVPGTLPLGTSPYCWVVAPSLAPPSTLSALFDGPVISHGRDTRASRALAERARAEGLATNQIVHSSSLTSCVAMAVDAMGPALLPRQMVQDAIAQRRLIAFSCGWLPDTLELFARFDPRRTPQFVRAAADLAAKIAQ